MAQCDRPQGDHHGGRQREPHRQEVHRGHAFDGVLHDDERGAPHDRHAEQRCDGETTVTVGLLAQAYGEVGVVADAGFLAHAGIRVVGWAVTSYDVQRNLGAADVVAGARRLPDHDVLGEDLRQDSDDLDREPGVGEDLLGVVGVLAEDAGNAEQLRAQRDL